MANWPEVLFSEALEGAKSRPESSRIEGKILGVAKERRISEEILSA